MAVEVFHTMPCYTMNKTKHGYRGMGIGLLVLAVSLLSFVTLRHQSSKFISVSLCPGICRAI